MNSFESLLLQIAAVMLVIYQEHEKTLSSYRLTPGEESSISPTYAKKEEEMSCDFRCRHAGD